MIAYAVTSYVFRLLEKNVDDWGLIKGRFPIVQAQQEPEFMNQPRPFGTYMQSTDFNSGDIGVMKSDTITYTLYANEKYSDKLDDSVELIFNAFTAPESADNISLWLHNPLNPDLEEKDRKYWVTYTQGLNCFTTDAVEVEGGKAAAIVSVKVGYHIENRDYSI